MTFVECKGSIGKNNKRHLNNYRIMCQSYIDPLHSTKVIIHLINCTLLVHSSWGAKWSLPITDRRRTNKILSIWNLIGSSVVCDGQPSFAHHEECTSRVQLIKWMMTFEACKGSIMKDLATYGTLIMDHEQNSEN